MALHLIQWGYKIFIFMLFKQVKIYYYFILYVKVISIKCYEKCHKKNNKSYFNRVFKSSWLEALNRTRLKQR